MIAVEDQAVGLIDVLHRHDIVGCERRFCQNVEQRPAVRESERGDFDDMRAGRDRRWVDLQLCDKQISQGLEFRRDAAEFIDRGVVIVGGLNRLPAVGPVGESEVRSAVEHVVAERKMAIEQPLRVRNLHRNWFGLVFGSADAVAPNREPGCVNLRSVNGIAAGDFFSLIKFLGIRQAVGGSENSGNARRVCSKRGRCDRR